MTQHDWLMHLRLWYAGMALQGLLSNPQRYGANFPADYVESAYMVADAMIAPLTPTH